MLERGTVVLVDLDPTAGLRPGASGLSKLSFALVDHIRSIDKQWIRRVYGSVSAAELGRFSREGVSKIV